MVSDTSAHAIKDIVPRDKVVIGTIQCPPSPSLPPEARVIRVTERASALGGERRPHRGPRARRSCHRRRADDRGPDPESGSRDADAVIATGQRTGRGDGAMIADGLFDLTAPAWLAALIRRALELGGRAG